MQIVESLFLLGGHDLEMLTIRNVLDAHGYTYVDHQLQWNNAKLSSYQEEIERYEKRITSGCIYGIELENDLPITPKFYKAIDHHNKLYDTPCALEQILSLLNVPTTREYQMIAANDKQYIPGMLTLGATEEEIKKIRYADRKAQGVTEEDERLAKKAISENLRQDKNLIVVKALSSRFSPICDRLYPYKSLLIYTSTEWMFYGVGTTHILDLYLEEFRNGRIFYGGGPEGYIGSKEAIYTEHEIFEMVKKIEYEFV